MQEIFNFLLQYWKPIVGLILVLVSFLLALVRKKPVNNLLCLVYEFAFKAVQDVEASDLTGPEEKLKCAVDYVKACLKAQYPDLNVSLYENMIICVIEEFLKAPQATKYKKGGK